MIKLFLMSVFEFVGVKDGAIVFSGPGLEGGRRT